jgi:hypothetical protein
MKTRFLLIAAAALVVAARPSRAQDAAAPDSATAMRSANAATPHVAIASAIDAQPAAVHRASAPLSFDAAMAATHQNMGQAKALMIVGAVGFVAGAVIGGDAGTIVMLGSAAVGLYGLYQYLQ